jgi:hypothetical protein
VRNDNDQNFFDLAARRDDPAWAELSKRHRSELAKILGG